MSSRTARNQFILLPGVIQAGMPWRLIKSHLALAQGSKFSGNQTVIYAQLPAPSLAVPIPSIHLPLWYPPRYLGVPNIYFITVAKTIMGMSVYSKTFY
jgi:hypothetical protein